MDNIFKKAADTASNVAETSHRKPETSRQPAPRKGAMTGWRKGFSDATKAA